MAVMPSYLLVAGTLTELLTSWQTSGEVPVFEALLAGSLPLIKSTASRTLRRHHVADPAAVDDAVSLVLDHLRRLPGGSADERLVARFAALGRGGGDAISNGGTAYIVWLSRERAIDIARSRRRLTLRAVCFSQLSASALRALADRDGNDHAAEGCDPPSEDRCRRLHDSVSLLEQRQRLVIELLLEGKTQTVIAHALDVCEGTVSRLRSKAVASLRRLLAD